jgi:hypothetical protein
MKVIPSSIKEEKEEDELTKLDRLAFINASARFELLSAN